MNSKLDKTPQAEETPEQFESRMINHGWCPKCLGDLTDMSDDATTVEIVCTICGYIADEYFV